MPRASPLPDEFAAAPFLVRDAVTDGVPPRRLRAQDLATPFHGVRVGVAVDDDADVVRRCHLYLPRLAPGQFFSHSTAAALWRIPLPAGMGRRSLLHVGAIPPAREPRTSGVIGHRLRIGFDQLTLADGLPVPSAAEVIAQLASLAGRPPRSDTDAFAREMPRLTTDDLIAAIDDVRTRELMSPADLEGAMMRLRRRGAVALEAALAESRTGAESPRETETRLHLTRAGLPEPELNWNLRDASGRFLARLDLAYVRWRVAVEYDGRQHAESAAQFERDADRWAAIAQEGWMLVRVLAHHLRQPELRIVAPVRRALLARGWSPAG